jgi:hypothetical protein
MLLRRHPRDKAHVFNKQNEAHMLIRDFPRVATAIASVCACASALAAPAYSFVGTIAIPAASTNPTGTFSGYDLSVFDPTLQLFYLTDRSNNGIDVFSSKSNSFVERIGAGLFAGATASNDNAGPNGISISDVPAGKLLIAGDGPSTFKTFTLAQNGLTVIGSPTTISTAVPGTPVPPNRVDGVAYAPTTNTILAANNASNPGFVTLINNTTGTVIRSIKLDGTGGYPNVAGNGVEATIFNSARGSFFVAVPVFNNTGAGGVIELDAANGNLLRTFDFNALGLVGGCGPTGMAQGKGASVVVACGDAGTNTIVLNPSGTGSIKRIPQVSGGDQVSFDPTRNIFFEAARFQTGGPVLGVIDGTAETWLQNLPITFNDHSVAVDPITGEVFVPFGASSTNAFCPEGCIGIFAPVPEPEVLSMMAVGLAGLAGLQRRRNRRREIGPA